jgi:uncharacterized protein YaaQ
MKMMMAIVQADDAADITEALLAAGLRVTRISTEGGWLRAKNATLLVGVEDGEVPRALDILKRTGQRRRVPLPAGIHFPEPLGQAPLQLEPEVEVEVGGAIVFVMDVERHERY